MDEAERRSFLATRWSMLDQLATPDDEQEWRWFIERYRGFARGILAAILRTRGRAGELDTALDEFWSYAFSTAFVDKADRGRRFRSFLAGTVRHFAKDYCRRNPRAAGQDFGEDDDNHDSDPASHDPLPENLELRLFAHQVLKNALADLATRHPTNATAIRLFYGLGEDHESPNDVVEPRKVADIAELLAIKPNAVHQTLYTARKRLRRRIEAEIAETTSEEDEYRIEVEAIFQALGDDAPGLGAE